MLPLNEEGVPIGKAMNTAGTIFDFNDKKYLYEVIGQDDEQVMRASGGIDHSFLLGGNEIVLADEESGRELKIMTDEKAVIVYTGSKIGTGFSFKEAPAQSFLGICLEVQNVPNSVKHPHLATALLKKATVYFHETTYAFSVQPY